MPIIIGIYVYDRSIDAINIEVSRAHTATLKQFRTIMDGRFDELTMLGSFLSLNRSIQKVMYTDEELNVEDRINIVEAQSELAKFHVAKNYIDNIFVYLNRSDILFSSTFKYGDNGKENTISDLLGIEYGEFQRIAAVRSFRDTRIHNGSLIFMQSLFLHDMNVPEGLYVAVFDRNWVSSFLETMIWLPEGSARITDGGINYVQSRGHSLFPEGLDQIALFGTPDIIYGQKNGAQIAMTNVVSEITDIRFVSAIPLEIYHKSARDIQTIILVYIVVYLLLGSGLSLVFARRNYTPLNKITKMLLERFGQSNDKEGNEFAFLENSFKKLMSRNISLVEILNSHSDSARNDFLVKLLKGKVKSTEKIKETMDLYEIKCISDKFVVAAFMIDDLGEKTFGGKAKTDEQTVNLVNFIIRSITEEMISENGHEGYVSVIDGLAACIVNIGQKDDSDTEKTFESIMDLLQKIIAVLEEKCEISVNLTVS